MRSRWMLMALFFVLSVVTFSTSDAWAGCGAAPSARPSCAVQPVLGAVVIKKQCDNCVPVVLKPACPNCLAGGPSINGCYGCGDDTSAKVGPIIFDPWVWNWDKRH